MTESVDPYHQTSHTIIEPNGESDSAYQENSLAGGSLLVGAEVQYPSNESDTIDPNRRTGEFVKRAPRFSEQVKDVSRTNPVEYVHDMRVTLGTATNNRPTSTMTEHELLQELDSFLAEGASLVTHYGLTEKNAQSLRDCLTFIGEPELQESSNGIYSQWKERLRSNPNAQIYAVSGRIRDSVTKSDAYVLDTILEHFSDDELEEFSGRLIIDSRDITAAPEDTNIIILDDWTVSGQQLQQTGYDVLSRLPEYRNSLEVQLLAAPEDRIKNGFDIRLDKDEVINVPINAYYAAHAASAEYARHSKAHITGAHAAADFDVANVIATMLYDFEDNKMLPAAMNIVRRYRKPGARLMQHTRLRGVPSAESRDKIPLTERID